MDPLSPVLPPEPTTNHTKWLLLALGCIVILGTLLFLFKHQANQKLVSEVPEQRSEWTVFKSEKYGIEMEVPVAHTFTETVYFTGEDTLEEYGGGYFTLTDVPPITYADREPQFCTLGFFLRPNHEGDFATSSTNKKILGDKEFVSVGDTFYYYDTGSISFLYEFDTNCVELVPELEYMLSTLKITRAYPPTVWQTYRNDTHGFELLLASDWKVEPLTQGIGYSIGVPDPSPFGINLKISEKSQYTRMPLLEYLGKETFNTIEFSHYSENQSQGGSDVYETEHNGKVYAFSSYGSSSGMTEKIISSLKFTR